MLHWGHTKQDRLWNECIREKVGIASIVEKIVESHLGGLVVCREVEAIVKSGDQIEGRLIA